MSITTTAAVLTEVKGSFSLETVELADLQQNELLVRLEASGICHSDVEAPNYGTPLPAVLGHEGVGIVEAVGSGVQRTKPGDRVIMSYPSCGHCSSCSDGHPFECQDIVSLCFSGQRADGTKTISLKGEDIGSAFFQQSSFANHAVVPEHNVVRYTGEVKSDVLASLPCGVQTGAGSIFNTFKLGAGDSLAVFGVGAVGLSALMAARVSGAFPLIAIDVNAGRLELALELGATHTINPKDGDVTERILEIAPGGVNFTLETSGNEQALNDSITGLASGGVCGIVTVPHMGQKYPFSPSEIFFRQASLVGIAQGSSVPRNFLPRLLELQKQGVFPIERLITTYDFSDINKAFQDAHAGHTIKPVITMT